MLMILCLSVEFDLNILDLVFKLKTGVPPVII